jgi:hypothetical protein
VTDIDLHHFITLTTDNSMPSSHQIEDSDAISYNITEMQKKSNQVSPVDHKIDRSSKVGEQIAKNPESIRTKLCLPD